MSRKWNESTLDDLAHEDEEGEGVEIIFSLYGFIRILASTFWKLKILILVAEENNFKN